MTLDTVIFAVVVGLRFLAPLRIPRFPLPAILVCLIIDAADQSIFQQFTNLNLDGYQTYDKALDIFYLSVAYVSVLRNWVSGPLVLAAVALWYYRLLGVVLFEYTEERWFLVIFANTFEYFFIAVEVYRQTRHPGRLAWRHITALVATIWIVFKLPQELWIHIAKLDFTDVLKEYIFGVNTDSPWATSLTNRPLVTAGLIILVFFTIAILLTNLRQELSGDNDGRIPLGHDWPRTVDADVVGAHLGWDPPSRVVRPTASFGWSYVEKVILTTMIAMIFANILPAFQVGTGSLILGTTVVIAVNTFLSEWLNERRVTMRTLQVLYVMMAMVNLGTVAIFYALLGGDETKIRFGNTAFFVGLLTLIVVLFDRYRQVSEMRRGPLFILTVGQDRAET